MSRILDREEKINTPAPNDTLCDPPNPYSPVSFYPRGDNDTFPISQKGKKRQKAVGEGGSESTAIRAFLIKRFKILIFAEFYGK